ncbi:MAG: threonine/serine ThrE exporter family protein [Acidimicrobiales bacterium]
MSQRRPNPYQARLMALRARDALIGPGLPARADPGRQPAPEVQVAYRILHFALRVGGAMLASGAGTVEVESTILDLTAACGLGQCEVDVTFTSMTASYLRADDAEPITTVRVVRGRTVNYGRLAALNSLQVDLTAGRITPEEAFARMDEVMVARTRRSPLVLLSWAGMATAFTVLLGGKTLTAAVAFVSAAVVTLLLRTTARRGIPDFFLSALGAAVATGFALTMVAIHAPARSTFIVAGGIMVLVPGYALVASVQDALTGFPISGTARGLEVLLTTAGIITGIAATLYLSVSVGMTLHLGSVVTTPFVQVPVQVAAAGVAAALYASATLVPRRSLAYAGLVGAGGWAVLLLLRHAGTSLIAATAVAAVLIGAASNVLAGRQQTHAFVFVVPGVMPLVPGLTIYQGMLYLFTGSSGAAGTLLRAVATGLAIAAGVTLGNMAIRPLRRSPGPRPAAGAPLNPPA